MFPNKNEKWTAVNNGDSGGNEKSLGADMNLPHAPKLTKWNNPIPRNPNDQNTRITTPNELKELQLLPTQSHTRDTTRAMANFGATLRWDSGVHQAAKPKPTSTWFLFSIDP